MARQLKAIIYSRVSTDAQERDGTSLDSQETACVEYARVNGWHVVDCARDTASGYSLERPGMERVRQSLRHGTADVVVAYAVDRLSRNQNQIGVLFDDVEQAGARLEFVTENFEDSAIGRFILTARAFVAEVEREKITERTMRGKAERAKSGRIPQGTGKGCYGYVYDRETGHRRINSAQALVVKRLFSDFLTGTPIVRIANQLNQDGIPTLAGKQWYPITLHRMLRNETYTGRTFYRRTEVTTVRRPGGSGRKRLVTIRPESDWIEVKNATPPIVDRDMFESVQHILDDPERRRLGNRKTYDYGLSGRVKCLRCGKAMVGQTLQKRYRYYRCRRAFAGPKHDRCPTVYVRADGLENAVKAEAARILADPQIILNEIEIASGGATRSRDESRLRHELENLEKQRGRLLKLYQLGEIDEAYLQNETRSLRDKIASTTDELATAPSIPQLPTAKELTGAVDQVREWVDQAEGDNLELLLEALQIKVRAERGRGELEGIVPEYAWQNSDADVRSMVGEHPNSR